MKRSNAGHDILASIRWHGIEGAIIPSQEGYGVFFTADPKRIIITIPLSFIKGLTRDTPLEQVEAMIEPAIMHIEEMLMEMHEKAEAQGSGGKEGNTASPGPNA